jgi:hypothetical protein
MNVVQKNIKTTEEKLKYIFDISFKSEINLILFQIFPDFNDNKLEEYEVQLEFDFLKEIDPDSDYIFRKINKIMKEISNFLKEYTINSDGRIKTNLPYEIPPPVLFGIDYLYGEKLILKMILRIQVG